MSSWKQATFKGKEIWAKVGPGGEPLVSGGRLPIRYSKRAGSKIYGAGASRVELGSGPIVELDEGVSADSAAAKKKKKGSGFGKAGTRTKKQAASAKQAAGELLEGLPASTIRAFTDGACSGNPGPAGSGAFLELPDGRTAAGSLSLGTGTNNIAELSAIGLALDLLEEAGVEGDAPVAMLTDSDYTMGMLVRGWKAKANKELILGLRERLASWPGVTLHWVAGHVGIAGNERADDLAGRGARGVSKTEISE